MPTPVGPVAPDPDDPDLWTEWYDDDGDGEGDGSGPSRFGWPVRLVAAIAILSIVLLLVL
ncbi:MAG TPA: hypothetical protein VM942_00765 [Acidimicrobiales bacterium]|nr:hypothetical protein [Acidimicrobiales bacterium]